MDSRCVKVFHPSGKYALIMRSDLEAWKGYGYSEDAAVVMPNVNADAAPPAEQSTADRSREQIDFVAQVIQAGNESLAKVSSEDLKRACGIMGLPSYGTKQKMLDELNGSLGG